MNSPAQHPYDQLTPDRVLDAVESLGYISDARILTLNSYENRVYQIGIEEEDPVIAKFYRPGRWSREQIEEEHEFTLELQAMEFPVVAPIKSAPIKSAPIESAPIKSAPIKSAPIKSAPIKSAPIKSAPIKSAPIKSAPMKVAPEANNEGKTLHEFNGFLFALFPRQGGHAPELDNLDNLLILGRTLGRIHKLGAAKEFTYRPEINLQRYGIDSVEFLLENDFIPAALHEAYETLVRDLLHRLQRIEQQHTWQSIRVHGDCHIGNILWRNNAPHFVDFDDTSMAPAIQDLWMLLSGDRQEQTLQMAEILEGYTEFMDFHPSELNLVEYFRTLRLLHYSGWLAKRWHDPAFPRAFTWFNTERYWAEHILELREQLAALDEPPLAIFGQL